jgi:hypothetical protein
MSIPNPLYAMCRQSVVIETYAGDDAYGAQTFSSAGTTYRCRIVNKNEVLQTAQGNEIVSGIQVILTEDVQIDPKSRVTLPASAIFSGGSSQPQIKWVQYVPDAIAGRLSHCKLWL